MEKASKVARAMVAEYGMSANLGAVKYGTGDAEPFMGRDYGHQRDYSEEVAGDIDAEVRDIIEGAHEGLVFIDNSTIKPETARMLAEKLAVYGVQALDAPVSGGDGGARNGTLPILDGGPAEAFDRTVTLLCSVGNAYLLCGAGGPGERGGDVSAVGRVRGGGAAVRAGGMRALGGERGWEVKQAWGMTEPSPLGSVATPPVGVHNDDYWRYRANAGRLVAGIEGRIVDDSDTVLPSDGHTVGEVQVRGPWDTGRY